MGLLLSVGAISTVDVAYVALGIQPSQEAATLSSFALGLAFVLWAQADARSRRGLAFHDFGFLVGVFMPISLLWYVIWSRGWRGLATLAALMGLMLTPWLAAVTAWLLLHGID
jgi:VIT1/CCC1 family predicted Fe2+/Mn2+ transporter